MQDTAKLFDDYVIKGGLAGSYEYRTERDRTNYIRDVYDTIINRDHIHSIEELDGRIASLQSDYETMCGEINLLSEEHERLSSLITQAELYFSLKEKPDKNDMEQIRLTVSRQSVENHIIHSKGDVDRLKTTLRESDKKLNEMREKLKRCQQLYAVYSDIAKTYREISKGDYISNLVQEKQKEEERKQTRAARK